MADLWKKRQLKLNNWSQFFGNNFATMKYEDFTQEPKNLLLKIYDFIKIADKKYFENSSKKQFKISWNNQHLLPPANERVLSEKQETFLVAPSEKWKTEESDDFKKLILKLTLPASKNLNYQ